MFKHNVNTATMHCERLVEYRNYALHLKKKIFLVIILIAWFNFATHANG